MTAQQNEKRLLTFSVYGAVAFAFGGIIVGILVSSQMILFDGLYSLISVALSMLSLYAAAFMSKKDTKNYPFGKSMIEPLVILIKYTAITILVAGSFITALLALFTGGREMILGAAMMYSAFATLVCLLFLLWFRQASKRSKTGLIKAEQNQWMMDTLVSTGVLTGFLLAGLLSLSDTLSFLVPYTDPVMVLLVTGYFIRVPVVEMKKALHELLEMRLDHEQASPIERKVKEIEDRFGMKESFIRLSRTGNVIWIEIDYVIEPDSIVDSVKMQDQIRGEIAAAVGKDTHWLTVSFTENRKWAI